MGVLNLTSFIYIFKVLILSIGFIFNKYRPDGKSLGNICNILIIKSVLNLLIK